MGNYCDPASLVLYFFLSDADEIPRKEVITFLKLYDGYPETFMFLYRWNVFGFFWEEKERGKNKIVHSIVKLNCVAVGQG